MFDANLVQLRLDERASESEACSLSDSLTTVYVHVKVRKEPMRIAFRSFQSDQGIKYCAHVYKKEHTLCQIHACSNMAKWTLVSPYSTQRPTADFQELCKSVEVFLNKKGSINSSS